ncbi:hypothetical protein [Pseudomonas syringae]|uniref:hypothetical protein n=1 Tax=Pseudomonas syringae TaxID=317 RepID=UPI00200B151C|nr:hypothetical protein [Pseudomonas syringae]MCK9709865.1 hypothetical protein [Pseudomonas syringae pv. syringae]
MAESVRETALADKLADAMVPSFEVEFDPQEADEAGCFREDALNDQDATESGFDQ